VWSRNGGTLGVEADDGDVKDPVEEQIKEAIARGEFDNLPGQGRPLPTGDDGPGWWARRQIEQVRRQDRLSELSARIDRDLGEVWVLRDETAVQERVTEFNLEIEAANRDVPIDEQLSLLDPADVLRTWRKMYRARR
jgi:hypothetical protein